MYIYKKKGSSGDWKQHPHGIPALQVGALPSVPHLQPLVHFWWTQMSCFPVALHAHVCIVCVLHLWFQVWVCALCVDRTACSDGLSKTLPTWISSRFPVGLVLIWVRCSCLSN